MITWVSTPAGVAGPSDAHARSSVAVAHARPAARPTRASVSVISTSGCAAWKRREQVAERHRRPGGDHAHAHVPAHAGPRSSSTASRTLAHRGQRRPRERQHGGARLGRRHASRAAVEQFDAQLALEPPHLRADARLRDQHPLRGAREARLLDDRDEVLQLPQFHTQKC